MFPVLCLWLRLHHKVTGKQAGIPVAGIPKPTRANAAFVFLLTPVYQFQCLFLIHHYLFILVYYMIRMQNASGRLQIIKYIKKEPRFYNAYASGKIFIKVNKYAYLILLYPYTAKSPKFFFDTKQLVVFSHTV